jgi:hypothetical protein
VTNDKENLFLLGEGNKLDENSPVAFFYVNSDNNTSTGFSGWGGSGAEYMLQNEWLYKYSGDGASWGWDLVGILPSDRYVRNSERIEVSVLLSDLKLSRGNTVGAGYSAYNVSWEENETLPVTAGELVSKCGFE